MSNYKVWIFKPEDKEKYDTIYKGLLAMLEHGAGKEEHISGGRVLKDCRIPELFHGDNWFIIIEQYSGSGQYKLQVM